MYLLYMECLTYGSLSGERGKGSSDLSLLERGEEVRKGEGECGRQGDSSRALPIPESSKLWPRSSTREGEDQCMHAWFM